MSGGLGKFEGDQVVASTIKVTNAGDGLSQALEVEPRRIGKHEVGYLVLRYECVDVAHPDAKKKDLPKGMKLEEGMCVRKHVLKTIDVAFAEEAEVAEIIIANQKRIRAALDSINGQGSLPVDPSEEP